jgi:hypothetical protein
MSGEMNLKILIQEMTPKLNEGEYVFLSVEDVNKIERSDTVFEFEEEEGTTVVMERNKADEYKLPYDFIASWITLQINSSLDAVGLTAAFSNKLASHDISCNVVAGFYHDHIFVNKDDAKKAIAALSILSKNYK